MESARLFIFASDGDWETASDDILGGVSGTLRKYGDPQNRSYEFFIIFCAGHWKTTPYRRRLGTACPYHYVTNLNKFHIKNVIKRGRSAYFSIVVGVQQAKAARGAAAVTGIAGQLCWSGAGAKVGHVYRRVTANSRAGRKYKDDEDEIASGVGSDP